MKTSEETLKKELNSISIIDFRAALHVRSDFFPLRRETIAFALTSSFTRLLEQISEESFLNDLGNVAERGSKDAIKMYVIKKDRSEEVEVNVVLFNSLNQDES